jgi:hypothetical protein
MGDPDSRRKLWTAREASNKCIYCGKKPPSSGFKGCKKCRKKKSEATCRFAQKHPHKQRNYQRRVRFDVLKKYGGKCKCCGESDLLFLTIDHVNEDGGEERRRLYGSQSGNSALWFLKLKREPIREDLQVLCYSCNFASFQFGTCPHRMTDEQHKEASQRTL